MPGDVVCVAQVVASDAAGLGFLTVGTRRRPDDLVVASRLVVTAAQAVAGLRLPPTHPDGTRRVLRTRPSQVPLDCGLRGTLVSRGAAPGGGLPPDGDLVVYLQCPRLPCDEAGVAACSRDLAKPSPRGKGPATTAPTAGADGRALWLGVGPPVGRVSPGCVAPLGLGGQPSSDDDEDDPLLPRPVRATRRGTCAQQ